MEKAIKIRANVPNVPNYIKYIVNNMVGTLKSLPLFYLKTAVPSHANFRELAQGGCLY